MPVDTFIPTAVIAEAPSGSPSYGTGFPLDVPANALVEDGTLATATITTGSFSNTLAYLFSGFVTASGSTPIADRIDAAATINSLFVEFKAARTATLSVSTIIAWLKKADLTSTTSSNSSLSVVSTPEWVRPTGGLGFGAFTTADVRASSFGVYNGLACTPSFTEAYYLDAVRIVVDWTAGTTTSRPRRQLTRLPDGRIAAVRARIR